LGGVGLLPPSPLELRRGEIAQSGVSPVRIVPALDIVEEPSACGAAVDEAATHKQLRLEGGEERLRERIVVCVAGTHLAVALGLKAVQQGYRTLFIAAGSLLAALAKAYSENRFEEKLKLYAFPKLLIIDEIGNVPVDRHAAHLFSSSSPGGMSGDP
jgi:IstB-like ATP binding protein